MTINIEGSRYIGFKHFLMQVHNLSEKSAKDYISRFNGIIDRGIYKDETLQTPTMEAEIKSHFEKSKDHYLLALKRYIEFQNIL